MKWCWFLNLVSDNYVAHRVEILYQNVSQRNSEQIFVPCFIVWNETLINLLSFPQVLIVVVTMILMALTMDAATEHKKGLDTAETVIFRPLFRYGRPRYRYYSWRQIIHDWINKRITKRCSLFVNLSGVQSRKTNRTQHKKILPQICRSDLFLELSFQFMWFNTIMLMLFKANKR